MAGELARLGIQIETQGAVDAQKNLEGMSASAAKAERATDSLAKTSIKATASLRSTSSSSNSATAAMNGLTKAQQEYIALVQAGIPVHQRYIDAVGGAAAAQALLAKSSGESAAAQRVAAQAFATTAKTITQGAAAEIAASEAVAAAATESATVQVVAHDAVAGSSVKIRESLVLLREASVGNYTRMAGSASILIQAFGLMEAVLVPLVAIGATLGSGFALGARQINLASGDLTKGLGLTQTQLDKVTQRTVTFKDVALATFQILGKDLASNFSGVVSDVGKDLDALAYDGELAVAGIAGGFNGAYQGIKSTWNLLPSVLGDAFVSSENIALSAIQGLVNGAISGANAVIDAVKSIAVPGSLASQMKDIGFIDLGQVKNDYATAGAAAATSFSTAFKKGFDDASAATVQFFNDVANQAKKNRIAEIIEDAGKASVKKLKDAADAADSIINKYAAQYERQTDQLGKLRNAYEGFHAKLADEAILAGQSAEQRAISVAEQKEIALATAAGLAPQLQLVDSLVHQAEIAKQLGDTADGITKPVEEYPNGFTKKRRIEREVARKLQEILS